MKQKNDLSKESSSAWRLTILYLQAKRRLQELGVDELLNSPEISGNTIVGFYSITNNTLTVNNALGYGSQIELNTFTGNGSLSQKTLDASLNSVDFTNNIIGISIDQAETYSVSVENNRAESGFSNFETSLAVNGSGAIIFTGSAYTGIINITAAAVDLTTITGINLLSAFQYFRIQPVSGLSLTITLGGNIILLASTGGTITLNGTNNDYCDFWTDGTFAYQNSAANNF